MNNLQELYGHKAVVQEHKNIVTNSKHYDSERRKLKLSDLSKLEFDIDSKINKCLNFKEIITNRIIEIKHDQSEVEMFTPKWDGLEGCVIELENLLTKI